MVVVLIATSCTKDEVDPKDNAGPVVVTTTHARSSQSQELFDTYAGLASGFAGDDVRAQFRMFERLVFTDTVVECYRQRCVEEILPEGSQPPMWAGYVIERYFGQPKKTIADPNGNSFVLQLYDGKVRVVGAGPDGKMGTEDDDVYPADLKGESWVFDKRPRQPER